MRNILTVLALEILLVIAACGVANIVDPNNHTWNGNTVLNGTVSGTHGQNVGTGDIVQFSLATLTSGLNITGGGLTSSVSGGSNPNAFSCNTSTGILTCVTIANSGALGTALWVTAGGTSLLGTSVNGRFVYTGTSATPTAGDVLCFYNPGIGFATSVGHAPITGGAVGTCIP